MRGCEIVMIGLLMEEYFQKIYDFLLKVFRVNLPENRKEWGIKTYSKVGLLQVLASAVGMILPTALIFAIVALIISL